MSTGDPLVSLIMPVWNPHPVWFPDAVRSALAQRDCAVELIVVDDGCPTPVEALLDGLVDERLQVLRVPHGRVSRARNAGIAAASGRFFRFVDCDDVILPESTARLVELSGQGGDAIAYGATLVCDERLRPLSTIETGIQGDASVACLLNAFETTIHSLLFPRRIVEAVGPWEPSIVVSQDWDYALRAFELAPVRGDRRVATQYRMHTGMNSLDVEQGVRGYRLVVERYFERHPEARGTRLERRAYALFHLFAAAQLTAQLSRWRAGVAHLLHAIGRDPATTLAALPRYGRIPLQPATRGLLRTLRRG